MTGKFTGKFTGFPPAAPAFFAALEADNSREFFTAHKATYDETVKAPFQALFEELSPEFGEIKLFRQNRDTRFSKDKSPYKTYAAGFAGAAPGIGRYVELSARGLLVGGGFHTHGPKQVERYRAAVDADDSGAWLERIVSDLLEAGFETEGQRLKTRPRGIAEDHPRLELLRYKELMVSRRFGTPGWLHTAHAEDEIRDTWRLISPLVDWVLGNVGPA
jgi:uncharacterized protein (TIGR02453 family)